MSTVINYLILLVSLFFCSAFQYSAAQKDDNPFKIEVTFIEGQNRNVSDALKSVHSIISTIWD
jgi:hypothetical protein